MDVPPGLSCRSIPTEGAYFVTLPRFGAGDRRSPLQTAVVTTLAFQRHGIEIPGRLRWPSVGVGHLADPPFPRVSPASGAAYAACANIASYALGYFPLHWAVEFLSR